jgi:hypothetical protein
VSFILSLLSYFIGYFRSIYANAIDITEAIGWVEELERDRFGNDLPIEIRLTCRRSITVDVPRSSNLFKKLFAESGLVAFNT